MSNYGNQNGGNIVLKRNLSGFGRGKFVNNQQSISDQVFNNNIGRNKPPSFLAKTTNTNQQTQDVNNNEKNDKKETKPVFY